MKTFGRVMMVLALFALVFGQFGSVAFAGEYPFPTKPGEVWLYVSPGVYELQTPDSKPATTEKKGEIKFNNPTTASELAEQKVIKKALDSMIVEMVKDGVVSPDELLLSTSKGLLAVPKLKMVGHMAGGYGAWKTVEKKGWFARKFSRGGDTYEKWHEGVTGDSKLSVFKRSNGTISVREWGQRPLYRPMEEQVLYGTGCDKASFDYYFAWHKWEYVSQKYDISPTVSGSYGRYVDLDVKDVVEVWISENPELLYTYWRSYLFAVVNGYWKTGVTPEVMQQAKIIMASGYFDADVTVLGIGTLENSANVSMGTSGSGKTGDGNSSSKVSSFASFGSMLGTSFSGVASSAFGASMSSGVSGTGGFSALSASANEAATTQANNSTNGSNPSQPGNQTGPAAGAGGAGSGGGGA